MVENADLYNSEVIWTLLAIKVLHTYYADKKSLWQLVEKKSRKFIQDTLLIDSAKL